MAMRSSKTLLLFTTAALLLLLALTSWGLWGGRQTSSVSPPCARNLHAIELAKEEWAQQMHPPSNAVPTWDDLQFWLPKEWPGGKAVCLEGGSYALNKAGQAPRCSIGGYKHSLPQ